MLSVDAIETAYGMSQVLFAKRGLFGLVPEAGERRG